MLSRAIWRGGWQHSSDLSGMLYDLPSMADFSTEECPGHVLVMHCLFELCQHVLMYHTERLLNEWF